MSILLFPHVMHMVLCMSEKFISEKWSETILTNLRVAPTYWCFEPDSKSSFLLVATLWTTILWPLPFVNLYYLWTSTAVVFLASVCIYCISIVDIVHIYRGHTVDIYCIWNCLCDGTVCVYLHRHLLYMAFVYGVHMIIRSRSFVFVVLALFV